ncbi:MAG: dethiobiotin synthase [Pseudoruegeria sp.]
MKPIVVVGTDTDIGKTIFSAGLTQALNARYFKPVQSGLDGETDSQVVARLTGYPSLPEAYRFQLPASPHLSAEAEGAKIDPGALTLPEVECPLVVEGAGGLLVPLNRTTLYLDVIAQWGAPVVLCARTQLGTINHSLLSLRALSDSGCNVIGIAFIGASEPEVEETIVQFSGIPRLGRLPMIADLTPDTLRQSFATSFDLSDFSEALS